MGRPRSAQRRAADGGARHLDHRADPADPTDLFTRLTPGSSYAANVLPGLIILGVGMGWIFAPAFSTATMGVQGSEAGIASAMVNASQQVGGSVGTSLLSTIFASAVANYAASHLRTAGLADAAAVPGYTTAFWWAVGYSPSASFWRW